MKKDRIRGATQKFKESVQGQMLKLIGKKRKKPSDPIEPLAGKIHDADEQSEFITNKADTTQK